MNIRIAGFGGQGIVLAGYVLGHAGILDGRKALQTQSYGSESRGGASKSDVIISDDEILELAPSELDVLAAMSQPALDKYRPDLKEGGLLVYDSDLVKVSDGGPRAFGRPISAVAHEKLGNDLVANMILVGYLARLTGVASAEALRKAVAESVPPKTVEVNLTAFNEGYRWTVA